MGEFRFKQFAVRQSRSAMKVGTDGVLLGAWFDPGDQGTRILDIGCGTGLIALMAAQRNPSARIDAVEIDEGSIADAHENISLSPWYNRINLYHSSFQEFSGSGTLLYDRIVSNPPYFINSLNPPSAGRTTARHTCTLKFKDLIDGALRLLTPDGSLSVILPPQEMRLFSEEAARRGLFPHRKLEIHSSESKPLKRVAMEFRRDPDDCIVERLVIDNGRHCYTEDYKELTGEFYLKFESGPTYGIAREDKVI